MTRACLIMLLILAPSAAFGQTTATADAPAHLTPGTAESSPVYFGGGVTLGFGNVTRIGVFPLVGYRLTPKMSLGAKLAYEYINDKRYAVDYDSHNYGASAFGRYFVVPQVYAHVEYQYISYDTWFTLDATSREWVPFLLVGGGYRTPISPRASAYVEILFDVLQDDMSPYDEGEPRFAAGVAVGF